MVNDFIILLPNIGLALIVFAIFFFITRTLSRLTRDLQGYWLDDSKDLAQPPSIICELVVGAACR